MYNVPLGCGSQICGKICEISIFSYCLYIYIKLSIYISNYLCNVIYIYIFIIIIIIVIIYYIIYIVSINDILMIYSMCIYIYSIALHVYLELQYMVISY